MLSHQLITCVEAALVLSLINHFQFRRGTGFARDTEGAGTFQDSFPNKHFPYLKSLLPLPNCSSCGGRSAKGGGSSKGPRHFRGGGAPQRGGCPGGSPIQPSPNLTLPTQFSSRATTTPGTVHLAALWAAPTTPSATTMEYPQQELMKGMKRYGALDAHPQSSAKRCGALDAHPQSSASDHFRDGQLILSAGSTTTQNTRTLRSNARASHITSTKPSCARGPSSLPRPAGGRPRVPLRLRRNHEGIKKATLSLVQTRSRRTTSESLTWTTMIRFPFGPWCSTCTT